MICPYCGELMKDYVISWTGIDTHHYVCDCGISLDGQGMYRTKPPTIEEQYNQLAQAWSKLFYDYQEAQNIIKAQQAEIKRLKEEK